MLVEQQRRPAGQFRIWVLAIAVLIALLAVGYSLWYARTPAQVANSVTASDQANDLTQTNTGGNVTIKATWQGRAAGPIFLVALDTHAVNLDTYDLKQSVTLRVDGGQAVQAVSWDAPKGGHHRSGTLSFPSTGIDGSPLISTSTRTVELVIRDVAGIPERVLRWAI